MDRGFWANRRVFLTGHSGFKGGWTALWLHALGAEVTGFALPPDTDPNLFSLARVGVAVRSIFGDIRDPDRLRDAMRAARPEIVFHMAAQPLVRHSYREPLETYATNVMGTAHVLDAVRHVPGVRAAVVVTSDKCYENRESGQSYGEDDRLGGYDPYSSSKACAELVTASYRSAFFNPARLADHGVAIASARAGNVIGGGDWASDRLLPDIVRAVSSGQPASIRNPLAVRPWQHVLEPLAGYLLLAEKLAAGGQRYCESWNFGPEETDAKAVGWIATKAVEMWGSGARWAAGGDRPVHEAAVLRLDSAKARRHLGWSPRWNVEQAIERTIDWHKAAASSGDAREITLEQIDAYERASALAVD